MSGTIHSGGKIIWSTKGWLLDNMFEEVKRLWPPGYEELLVEVIGEQERMCWILLDRFDDDQFRMFHRLMRECLAQETRVDPKGVIKEDWKEILDLLDTNPRGLPKI